MRGDASLPLDGSLSIALPATPGGGVDIRRRPAPDATKLLSGKPAETAARVIPALFVVCEHAHRQAAHLALGGAYSSRLSRLTAMETLREHVMRVSFDWAGFLGEASRAVAARSAVALVRELSQDAEPATVIDRAEALLAAEIFGASSADWLAEDLTVWARRRETLAARLIARIMDLGWMDAGAAEIDQDASVFARRRDDPKLEDLGSGLGARMAARLVELARLPGELRRGGASVDGRNGVVAAARGPLRHDARLHDGRIASYRVATPTDANFGPDGVAARCLAALDHPDRETRMRQARWLVSAIDPCMGFEIGYADA